MNRIHAYLVLPLLGLSVGNHACVRTPVARVESPEQIASLVERVQQHLSTVRTYSVRAQISAPEQGVRADGWIKGETSSRLRMEYRFEAGGSEQNYKVIFDGKQQWMESKSSTGVEVVRVNLKDLVTQDHPFDTSLSLMGSGLLNGEDFPATMLTLLKVYDFSGATSEGAVVHLKGTVNRGRLERYYATRVYSEATSTDKIATAFRFIQLDIDVRSAHVMGYSCRSTEGSPPLISVMFSDLKENVVLPADSFKYGPPAGVNVQDLTESILSRASVPRL